MSRTTRFGRAVIGGVAIAALALTAVPVADAGSGHSRTRPGTSSATARPSGSASGTAARGGDAVRVSGHARYGYGAAGRYHGWGGYYGRGWYGGWYGWPWYPGVDLWWSWPVYGWYPMYAAAGDVVGDARYADVPGRVETDVRPRRSAVWLDGSYVGEARDFSGRWDALYLPPGVHELRFERNGYRSLTVQVDVRPGATHHVGFELREGDGVDPRSTEPPRELDTAPATSVTAEIEEGERADEQAALRTGRLRVVAAPADAAVYLDGEFLASAGELARLHGALPVAAGRHVVDVVRPGHEPQRRTVVVESGTETLVVEVTLSARP